MTIFDVKTDYPATSLQVKDLVASSLGLAGSCVKVQNMAEEKEHAINHANDKRTGEAIVGTEYEPSNNQDLVGDEYAMSFLKELNKDKHQGTQVKGYNDELLADGAPAHSKETPGKQVKITTKPVNLFTKQDKVPTVKDAIK